jgi:uncharacterized membrane protein
MATTATRRRSGTRPSAGAPRSRDAGHGRPPERSDPGATKEQTKPDVAPEKARKPRAARKAAPPIKAKKPRSGKTSRPAESSRSAKRTKKPIRTGAGKALANAVTPRPSSLAGKATLKLAKVIAGRAVSSGTEALAGASRQGAERAAAAVSSIRDKAIEAASTSADVDATGRPPIQAAVDAAVPSRVAWQEWIRLEWLPEGVDSVIDVQDNGDGELTGHLRGDGGRDWAATILDEREEDSFAWESVRGSDCAGLITFRALGDQLTRIQLTLDVRPVTIAQAAALSTRLADRRAAADLRRFRARLELIRPDEYPDPNERTIDREANSR